MTIADALREFEDRGYIGQFSIRKGGSVECANCGTAHRAGEVSLEGMRRIEGVSDPADMVFIGALRCPECDAIGTATINYGPLASAADAEVLRALDDHRAATAMTHATPGDGSLVRDTGWLTGPDDR